MFVPTQCDEVECDVSSAGADYTLCKNVVTLADDMMNADVCSDPAKLQSTKILQKCGQGKKLSDALECTLGQCDAFTGNQVDDNDPQDKWKKQMGNCLTNSNESNPADECLSSAQPLDCSPFAAKQVELCELFDVRFKALNTVCQRGSSGLPIQCKKKWTTPTELEDCFSDLYCKGKNSHQKLKKDCMAACYNMKDDTMTTAKAEKCLINKCDLTQTTKATDASPKPQAPATSEPAKSVPPPPNTINPSGQGNTENDPTSVAPQDQDITSGEEDEGFMVRANQKIIIAFAANFVVASFLKALPVEN